MTINVNCESQNNSYSVFIEEYAIAKAYQEFNLDRKVLIITDDGIPKEYFDIVKSQCARPYSFVIKQGEESKNIDNYCQIIKYMQDNLFTRHDCIVALGGGVVGDLSGFIASTYMRGIDFYNIPTTLLSQIDSSIGGKNAINTNDIKNSIGSFYNPKKVLIDPVLLKTLDSRQLSSGVAEIIKIALTTDKDLFRYFELETFMDNLEFCISTAILDKIRIVEKDYFETDLRKVLNFGHTIGHGIESLSNGSLLHGECVAIGMLPMCSNKVREKLKPILEKYNLPTICNYDKTQILERIKHDKKSDNDLYTIVKVDDIGTFNFDKVSIDEISSMLDIIGD